jgi:arylsulfatase A-like enzyme
MIEKFKLQKKGKILLLLFVLVNISVRSYSQKNKKKRPNVIVVITDDQGYGDLGCHGNEVIKTPNIDKFYSESTRLTNFHVSPTCAPTRSSIMTGRYANRVGVWHTIAGRSLLWEDEVTLANVFSENGYTNGLFGKWHLGDNYPFRPIDRGFDEVVRHGGGGITQGPDYWGNDYFDDTLWHNGVPQKYEGYCTDVYFNEALNFIEKNKDTPFLCYISTNAPHGPLNVPEKYHEMYKEETRILDVQKRFYGMISNVDDNFALLREKLKSLEIEDNTILIFMTDNGTAYGNRYARGKSYGFNAGMKGNKNSEYDGGHRVPFFIRYPNGNLPKGKDVETMTAHIDILPSLIDLCNLKKEPEHKPFDGLSFVPLLKGKESKWKSRTLVVDSQRRRNIVKWRKSSVMEDNWRLVNGKELYDVSTDVGQRKNIANEHPEKVASLRTSYDNWWQSFIDEGSNERYAYIQAGGKENPLRISAHDMHTESTKAHSQVGALIGHNPLGIFKIEILEEGNYTISLCRYPRESGLAFNTNVAAIKPSFELEKGMPASKVLNLTEANLSFAQYDLKKNVNLNEKEVVFTVKLEKGKYDLDGFFKDIDGVKYPPYYMYINKI